MALTTPLVRQRPLVEGEAIPQYVMDRDGVGPVIVAPELCPACEGEGHIAREVRGGRWNSYVGTWEPDEVVHVCDTCEAAGVITVRRCAACGCVEQDDENGLHLLDRREAFCECDEDALDAFRARLERIEAFAREQDDLLVRLGEAGLGALRGIHGLTWNEAHAIAARQGQPLSYYRADSTRARGFVSTGIVRQAERPQDTVWVYALWDA